MNEFRFLDAYAPIFYEDKTYWILSGGRGSGKSTNVAAYFLMKLMGEEYFRGVIARYTAKAVTNSIYQDVLDLINAWGIRSYLEITGDQIRNKLNENMIITHSMKLSEGTISAKGKGLARVTHLLIDEATELNSEEEYIKLVDSFRHKGAERRIFLVFNPTTRSHWIFKRFYLPDGTPNPKWLNNHGFIHTTYRDNEQNLDSLKVAEWESLSSLDPEYFDHHILGKWKHIGDGQVFKNWKFMGMPDPDAEVVYGLDFGFSSDPSALIKVSKRDNRIWLEELIYERELTAEDLAERMEMLGIPKTARIYADAARPDMIETIRRRGYSGIRKSNKGPGSIESGIDRIKSYEVFCSPLASNLIEEYYAYSYKAGSDKPIDANNHLMDSLRYAVAELKNSTGRYGVQGYRKNSNSFYEDSIQSFR
jgi:phage terminase large subunit